VKDKNDIDAFVNVLIPEDVRAEFNEAFRKFSQSMDMILPDPKALPYLADYRQLGKVRQAAATRFHDQNLDISDCGPKVRKLIEEAIIADGIQILVQKVSLFSAEFDEKLKALKSDEAQASEMEHALRHEIHVRLDEDPAYYQSLRQRLEEIIEDRKARRIDAAKRLELWRGIEVALKGRNDAAEAVGLSPTAFAIYGLLQKEKTLTAAEKTDTTYSTKPDPAKVDLASLIEENVTDQITIVDWVNREDVQKEMRKRLKRILRVSHMVEEQIDGMAEQLVNLLKRRNGR
jgi:type I restriction enzyme, R subunit